MSRIRLLALLPFLFALLTQQAHAQTKEATRIAVVKGNSLCLIEDNAGSNCMAASESSLRLPLWSKEGDRVAYVEDISPSQALAVLHIVDRHGQSLLRLPIKPVVPAEISSGMRAVEALQWVDRDRIAVSGSVNPSTQEVLVIDLQRNTVVDELVDDGGGIAFSPDGKHTAQWTGAPHFTPSIERRPALRIDGIEIALPPSLSSTVLGTPLWSPDSRTVALQMKDIEGRNVVAHWQGQGRALRLIKLPPTAALDTTRTDLFWLGSTLQLRTGPRSVAMMRPGAKGVPEQAWSISPGTGTSDWSKVTNASVRPSQAARLAKTSALKKLAVDFARTPPELADVWCQACGMQMVARHTGAAAE